MYDPAVPEELDSTEPDMPPEVEVFLEAPTVSAEIGRAHV